MGHRDRASMIFSRIVALPDDQREQALSRECAGDLALMSLVEQLLTADLRPDEPVLLRGGDRVGRYLVRERIGVGGMAEVWLVVHEQLGTRHALKVLLYASDDLRRRLEREGRAQSILRHENLLPVRDILEFEGAPALLMPLIEGPSLSGLLKEYRPTRDEALALLAGIVRGVGHAHDCGYIHRDLKPGNVLLDLVEGRVCPRVADFGLVKRHAGTVMTRSGALMGTPAYAAPEQLLDAGSVDETADLFSLGVMLVELLEGRRPFFGTKAQMIQVAHGKPPNLGSLEGPLRDLAIELLEVDPDARPSSCAEVLDRLGAPGREVLGKGELVRLVSAGVQQSRSRDASTAAPRQAGDEAPHNLPNPRDGFVGRRDLKDMVAQRLRGACRLVTLTGMGGSGKTRVALEASRDQLTVMTGGVYWIDLTEARDRDGIVEAVAAALDVRRLGGDPIAQLGAAMAARGRCLLLFDNFEQVVDCAVETVGAWLDRAEESRFLVTSRLPLQLRGETVIPVAPLGQSDAVELFALRAAAANADFRLSDANLDAVVALVELLDGLPLAVELAAARSRMYTPAKLVNRMTGRFRVLSRDAPDVPERHRTLRATLQWSWDLLSLVERATLAQLSVFEGGFTLDAVEAVVDLSAFRGAPWVEDVVAKLLDHSLVTLDKRGREPRFAILVSVRAFASRRLERPEGAELRHGRFFAELDRGRHPTGEEEALWAQERDNLLAACNRAIDRGDAAVAARTALAVGVVLNTAGASTRAADFAVRALGMPGHTPLQRAQLLCRAGRILGHLHDGEQGRLRFREAFEILDGDERPPAQRVRFLCWANDALFWQREGNLDEARRLSEAAIEGLEALDCPVESTNAEFQLGKLLHISGDPVGAEARLVSALARSRRAGLPRTEGLVLDILARQKGDTEPLEARELWHRALDLAREHDDSFLALIVEPTLREFEYGEGLIDAEPWIGAEMRAVRAWHEMGFRDNAGIYEARAGRAMWLAGRADEARIWLRRALETLGATGNSTSRSRALCVLGEIALSEGRRSEALELAEQAVALGVGIRVAEEPARALLAAARASGDPTK